MEMKYSDMRGSSGIVGFIVHKWDGDDQYEAVAACIGPYGAVGTGRDGYDVDFIVWRFTG